MQVAAQDAPPTVALDEQTQIKLKEWSTRMHAAKKDAESQRDRARKEAASVLPSRVDRFRAALDAFKTHFQDLVRRVTYFGDEYAARYAKITPAPPPPPSQASSSSPAPMSSPPPSGPAKKEGCPKKDEKPQPGMPDYAVQVADRFPELRMTAKSAKEGSRCGTEGQGLSPTAYQLLIPTLAAPDRCERGFLLYHSPGSGKTGTAIRTIVAWYRAAAAGTLNHDRRQVLVLLPERKLIKSWTDDLKKLAAEFAREEQRRWTSDTRDTTVLDFKHAFRVVFHYMHVRLPDSLFRDFGPSAEYVLPTDYRGDEYKGLSNEERAYLQKEAERTRREVTELRVGVPPGGLVIVDEADNLINSGETARTNLAARMMLGWANAIRRDESVQVLLLTATPLLDDERLTDLIKLLSLILVRAEKQFFEGVWRPSIVTHDVEAVRVDAYKSAERAEEGYLRAALFEGGDKWKPGQKERFQRTYAGRVSYVTLENDPTVYPRIDSSCPAAVDRGSGGEPGCTFRFDPRSGELEVVRGLPRPKLGVNVLVPMNGAAYAKYRTKLSADIKASQPLCRTAACLPYGSSALATGVTKGWGTREFTLRGRREVPNKLRALGLLMKQHPRTKQYVFSGARDYVSYGRPLTRFFESKEGGGFEAVGSRELVRVLLRGDDGIREWYRIAGKRRRFLFLGRDEAVDVMQKLEREVGVFNKKRPGRERTILDVALDLFNHKENKFGEFIEVLVGDRSAKAGLNIFDTRVIYEMEPATSKTAETQSTARVLRYCAMNNAYPDNKDWTVRLYRFISTAPSSAADTVRGERQRGPERLKSEEDGKVKTNDEYQQAYLETHESPAGLLLTALQEAALDCRLFRSYNGKPARCMGDPETMHVSVDPRVAQKTEKAAEAVVDTADYACVVANDDLYVGLSNYVKAGKYATPTRLIWTVTELAEFVGPESLAEACAVRSGSLRRLAPAGLETTQLMVGIEFVLRWMHTPLETGGVKKGDTLWKSPDSIPLHTSHANGVQLFLAQEARNESEDELHARLDRLFAIRLSHLEQLHTISALRLQQLGPADRSRLAELGKKDVQFRWRPETDARLWRNHLWRTLGETIEVPIF